VERELRLVVLSAEKTAEGMARSWVEVNAPISSPLKPFSCAEVIAAICLVVKADMTFDWMLLICAVLSTAIFLGLIHVMCDDVKLLICAVVNPVTCEAETMENLL